MSQGNYAEEFKEHILSEHEAGVSVRELARRYEPSATTIQNWKRQAKAKASESEPGESEVSQLRRIQRRNQELEQENAFFRAPLFTLNFQGYQRPNENFRELCTLHPSISRL